MAAGVFPLIPRRRVIGLAFGGVRSVRRGTGSDVAGSRQYVPGDNLAWIDWAASARLSAVRDTDEFIVHEFFADEAPHVVMVADRRASMGIRASPLRRLDKPEALLAEPAPDRRERARRPAASPATSTMPTGRRTWRAAAERALRARRRTRRTAVRRAGRHRLARPRAPRTSTGASCRRRPSCSSSRTSSSRRTRTPGGGRSSTAGSSCRWSSRIRCGSGRSPTWAPRRCRTPTRTPVASCRST